MAELSRALATLAGLGAEEGAQGGGPTKRCTFTGDEAAFSVPSPLVERTLDAWDRALRGDTGEVERLTLEVDDLVAEIRELCGEPCCARQALRRHFAR